MLLLGGAEAGRFSSGAGWLPHRTGGGSVPMRFASLLLLDALAELIAATTSALGQPHRVGRTPTLELGRASRRAADAPRMRGIQRAPHSQERAARREQRLGRRGPRAPLPPSSDPRPESPCAIRRSSRPCPRRHRSGELEVFGQRHVAEVAGLPLPIVGRRSPGGHLRPPDGWGSPSAA